MRKQESVLVCVTGQRDCDRLIRAGKEIAQNRGASLQVLCVVPPQVLQQASPAQQESFLLELEYLRQVSREAGADMAVYFQKEAPWVAAGMAKKVKATQIVTGLAQTPGTGFVEILHTLLPKIPVSMVSRDGTVYHICPQEPRFKKVWAECG